MSAFNHRGVDIDFQEQTGPATIVGETVDAEVSSDGVYYIATSDHGTVLGTEAERTLTDAKTQIDRALDS